ncbi:ankyrin repeat domain-containing protein [Sphingomicrobium sediminis]|uniref:Ankyrin repeat domain-containing protein n=1 Tax=Sphingomicrobium sediminis TaxID=2950949 RepID=A0A9X2EMG5_9SPHN|nr:ankyrin repeat domain-containing protein [Sphingomicrobium sediminis]MCM8558094.1 ankyrin repeat domain-containing protein [Sphingomicrobium sediminis]
MMRIATLFAALIGLLLTAEPAAAQKSEGEDFLRAIRAADASKVVPMMDSANGPFLVNYRGSSGETALIILVRDKRPLWVRTLLSKGANPNTKDADGMAPIHYATELQSFEMIETLLVGGADPNIGNRFNETALMTAVRLRNARIVKLLLDNGANPDITDSSAGLSARDYARRETRNPELLRLIEEAGKPRDQLQFGPVLR